MQIPVNGGVLQGFVSPMVNVGLPLTVFIEGDGFAWVDRSTPSSDPTPMKAVALQMALAHPHANAAYLARPCQYLQSLSPMCRSTLWTQARFSAEVMGSMMEALDFLKLARSSERMVLVGFSGGGALATLLAAHRSDVVGLITVAGNLDPDAWTRWHKITPLRSSLNPVDVATHLGGMPQLHALGELDREIPVEMAEGWPLHLRGASNGHLMTVQGADHLCCWQQAWPRIWERFEKQSKVD